MATTDSMVDSTVSNHEDPFFIQSSDYPGMKLVAHNFEGVNFSNWKRSMLIALSTKKKSCFIDGTCPKPASTASNAKSWQRCNDMVFSWILNALSPAIADSVLYCDTAKAIWDELKDRYDQTNGAQLYSVHKKLNDFSQGNDGITTYFTKIKLVWDEIDAMGMNPTCSCTCSCGSKQKQVKYQEDQRVVQFLMGLNDSYTAIRGTILMQNPLPKLVVVYNNLVQEERQREIHNASQFQLDSVSMFVENSRNPGSYGQNYRHTPYGQNSGNINRNSQGYNGNQFNKRPPMNNGANPKIQSSFEIFCNYCKKPGHKVENCFKLQNINKRFAANVHCSDADGIMGAFEGNQHVSRLNEVGQNSQIQSFSASFDFQNNEQMDTIQYIPSSVNFAGLFYEEANDSW